MSIFKNNCPVPFAQQPLNEYLELRKSWLFSWSTYSIKSYLLTVIIMFLFLFLFFGLVIFFLLIDIMSIFRVFLLDFVIVHLIFFFIFIRLYLGWSYVVKRLLSATVFYEESGWYDGQIWIKTAENLTRDRLIGLYQIVPFLSRIRYTCLVFFLNIFLDYYLYYNF
uniref:Ycf36 n=1 Tax=Thuretia quercifolia TaxID=189650 RepID=A0A1Z1MK21_9FLOR|nr:hypothetical protein [Thuretia quercifolia]ARW66440.1 hypothetical protein [Thuretia quercifolia]